MKRLLVVLILAAAVQSVVAQKTAFSTDSAYAALRTIVEEFGPRPMGSPSEQRALAFAAEKFRASGCDTAYVMPMRDASGVNTTSGIAVGIHKGKSGRIILIGGHMDSAGPDIPGANDDGSGAACVIELARVLAKRPTESTVVFCCWGGEERGLMGSEYFVDHFDRLDSIALMIQLDMADGASILEIDPDAGRQISAPHWLVDAALDIFYNDLGYQGLVYVTQSATINGTSGSTGSDHQPFLEKGIPAIDFTSDVDYPIHSQLDNLQNFTPSGMAKSGDVALKLFERFDAGTPSRSTESYWLVQWREHALYASHGMIWVFIVLSLVLATVAYFVSRKNRLIVDETQKIRWSGVKIILFLIVILACAWLAGDIISVLRGIRYPWANNFEYFVLYGVLLGLLGAWVTLRWTRTLPLTRDAHVFARWALVFPLLFTVLLTWANVELGLYGAASLLCVAAALLVKPDFLKYVFVALAPLPIIRLVWFEESGLLLRLIAQRPGDVWWGEPVVYVVLVLVSVAIALPYVHAFSAVYRITSSRFLSSRWVRGCAFPGIVFIAILGWTVFLINRPVYNHQWEPEIKVTQRYTYGADSSTVALTSGEWLNGTVVRTGHTDSLLHDGTTWRLAGPSIPPVRWSTIASSDYLNAPVGDSLQHFTRKLSIRSEMRPLTIIVTYRSDKPLSVISPWYVRARGSNDRVKIFEWYSYPEPVFDIPVTFAVRDSQKISESIDITYASLAYPLDIVKDKTIITRRTLVHRDQTLNYPLQILERK